MLVENNKLINEMARIMMSMLKKEELIEFILKNSKDLTRGQLKHLKVQELVIIKVEIEVKTAKKKRKEN